MIINLRFIKSVNLLILDWASDKCDEEWLEEHTSQDAPQNVPDSEYLFYDDGPNEDTNNNNITNPSELDQTNISLIHDEQLDDVYPEDMHGEFDEAVPEDMNVDDQENEENISRENVLGLLRQIQQYKEELEKKDAEICSLKKTVEKQNKILECFRWDLHSFQDNDRKVTHLTGLPSYITLAAVVDFVRPGIMVFSDVLSKEQVIIMVLMYIRLGLCFSTLSVLFRVCTATVTRYFYSGLYSMYMQLKGLVKWPSPDLIASNTPAKFHKLYNAPIAVILDCFEVFTEKPGVKDAIVKMYSTYKHHHTVKELIGITSFGSISFISKPYSGRTSDKYLTETCGFLENLHKDDIVLADRGFTIRKAVQDKGAILKVPDSSSKKKQLSSTAIERTRALASIRNEVERSIGSLRQKSGILSTRLPITLLNHEHNGVNVLHMIVTLACALFNLCPSIISST
ncbi:uncharacterized protein LOC120416937 isoform X2 [Culex pipiens pallens]|uniref:uncharacterized protein LOC120416937 isoform X2 n=1 Tax=Culex pipiens pallens TaxID=42434 RepID=UPI00195341FB|nr:uncharacterized protein LOC120416937 isoform X2 [Culex pipiens pallens]